jgi:site-specific recombinase XerD
MPRKEAKRVRGVWERTPGSGVWWIRYRVRGVLKREKAGSKVDAIKLLMRRKDDLLQGIVKSEAVRQPEIRFETLCEDILVFSRNHHREPYRIQIMVKKILPEFGEKLAQAIKPADIDAWLSQNTRTPATSNRYRSLFSLIFREALHNEKCIANPARLVRQRSENNGRIRFLTETEETRLRDAVRSLFPEHEAELTISLNTGMRLSEQYTLIWKDIDFKRREINLDRTKNGSPRMIPMNDAVMEAMASFASRSPSTSPEARVFAIKNPNVWFKPAIAQAKIEDYRWHDNRHTFCSRLAMRGHNLTVIQQLAGHKTIEMSARYAHLGEKSLHAAVSGL